jgi:acetyltransferase-like isoleucine patch superfamily enzyme
MTAGFEPASLTSIRAHKSHIISPMQRIPLYILTSGQRLDLFDEPIGESLILNRPLKYWQQQAAERAGLQIEFIQQPDGLKPPYFIAGEDVFFTNRYLNEFSARAIASEKNSKAGLLKNPLLDLLVSAHPVESVNGGYCYDLRYVMDPIRPESHSILLAMDDLSASTMKFPLSLRDTREVIYCSSTMAILQIQSPLHVYQANMHKNLEAAAERIRGLGLAATGRAPEHVEGVQGKWNQIGSYCDIHPTAYVEGCQIGDGASIGAHAVCRYSVIGNGARISDSVNMFRSIVGDNSSICEQHRVIMSVLYPECFLISGALQFSIMGYASAIFAAWITDARTDQKTIKTVIRGKVVDTGMYFLGCIMGHHAKITAGVITAPGRIIPNHAVIHQDQSLVFNGLPENHPPGEPFFLKKRE